MRRTITALCLAAASLGTPAAAQIPGAPEVERVQAGEYRVDRAHSQIAFSINHLGFNAYHGIFGDISGSLTLDPARPSDAQLFIEIPIGEVVTTSAELNQHLLSPDFFDAATFPVATFRSTDIAVDGETARITGDLTIRGVTRPVVLDARFVGAGINPMTQAETVGFEATAQVRRSDFGIDYALPALGDTVDLRISVAFER